MIARSSCLLRISQFAAPVLRAPFQGVRRSIIATPPRASAFDASSGQTTTTTTTSDSNGIKPELNGAAEKMKGDVSGAMLEPSVANKNWVRSLATIAAVCVAAYGTGFLPSKATAFVHLAAFGTMLGTIIWHTFFVGLLMFKTVPRQTFGRIQSVLFPNYFALTTGANIIMLATLLLGAKAAPQGPIITLSISLACSLLNWLAIEPVTTRLMFERYDLENLTEKTDAVKAKIQALYKQFGKFHGISSVINLAVMCCVFAHGWFLGSLLVM